MSIFLLPFVFLKSLMKSHGIAHCSMESLPILADVCQACLRISLQFHVPAVLYMSQALSCISFSIRTWASHLQKGWGTQKQKSLPFWHHGTHFVKDNFPQSVGGVDAFGMILIRRTRLRPLTCAVHSSLCTPMRISCHHWSDRRQSSGSNVSDGEQL